MNRFMPLISPFKLSAWIDQHREQLKPPVCNKMVWQDSELMVMIVGGPNNRKDYHIDPGEEFFYQIEGAMELRIIENGARKTIRIQEGEIFLLPANIPHSPQRFENTVGMVIERIRRQGELDHLRWYCEACDHVLYDESFQLTDLGTQLKPVIERFYSDEKKRTCTHCGTVLHID